MEKAEKIKQYQREYYLKTREKRKQKRICEICGRQVSAEYLQKHKKRSICEKHGGIEKK